MDGDAKTTWLTLGAASTLLGVSESTVRRWADAGQVRSYRTSGGHRRVADEDLRQLVTTPASPDTNDSVRISDLALARAKRRISGNRQPASRAAFESFGEEARERLRLIGRQLVDLFARFITTGAKGERFSEDARTIGHDYGRTLIAAGVGLTAAVGTFNVMRYSIEETAAQIASEAGLSSEEAVDALERVLHLTDTVLEGLAEIYERGH
ncbi:MAG: excisionase family DNA-binding protein [Dehalococcoidia bacterium]